MGELLVTLGLTAGLLGGGRLAGIPLDNDRTLRFNPSHCYMHPTAVPGLQMCDKTYHAVGGSVIVGFTVALHRGGTNEPCWKTALRGVARAQLASMAYEVGTAVVQRRHRGELGFGIGMNDHLAVTMGSVAAAAGMCGARALLGR